MLRAPGLASGIELLPQIAKTANRAYVHSRWLDLRAQARNIDLDRVDRKVVVVIEQLLTDEVLAEHPSGARQEQLEQRPLPNGEIDRNTVGGDALGLDIDRQCTDHDRARGHRGSPQQRSDASFEFGQRKRLGQIVVGAEIESAHAVLDRVARRQDQNIRLRTALAPPSPHLETVDVGQTDVENQKLIRRCPQRAVGTVAVLYAIDAM